jgi:hypothetical protein
MNESKPHFGRACGALGGRVLWTAALLLLAISVAVPMWGSDATKGGATPYTPTQGEWLWLALNAQQALFNSEQEPGVVTARYLYNRSKPNTIQIELLVLADASNTDVRRVATLAEQRTLEMAKLRGWDKWLGIEFKETKLTGPPQPEALLQ